LSDSFPFCCKIFWKLFISISFFFSLKSCRISNGQKDSDFITFHFKFSWFLTDTFFDIRLPRICN
jgi:hypothetical protein